MIRALAKYTAQPHINPSCHLLKRGWKSWIIISSKLGANVFFIYIHVIFLVDMFFILSFVCQQKKKACYCRNQWFLIPPSSTWSCEIPSWEGDVQENRTRAVQQCRCCLPAPARELSHGPQRNRQRTESEACDQILSPKQVVGKQSSFLIPTVSVLNNCD